MKIILKTSFGSHLYGTSTPASDNDIKAIYIPDGEDILLQSVKGTIATHRSKSEGEKNYAGEEDIEMFSLQRYFKLLSEGQTVSLDVLFSNPESWIEHTTEWLEIVNNRHRLLTRRSEAFIGYCRQQAKKYGIKGSRVAAIRSTLDWLNHGTSNGSKGINNKLGEFHLWIDAFVAKENNEFIKIVPLLQGSGTIINHLEVCGRKLPYTATVKNAIEVLDRLFTEYGTRALQAETNLGVDFKAISHAVRIGQQAVELFETHNIVFPRPNAAELLEIKQGKIPYLKVAEQIEELFSEVEKAAALSDLPEEVDHAWMKEFVERSYLDAVFNQYRGDILSKIKYWDL